MLIDKTKIRRRRFIDKTVKDVTSTPCQVSPVAGLLRRRRSRRFLDKTENLR